jgi:hypothetical protein
MTAHYEGFCPECGAVHTRTLTTDGDEDELEPVRNIFCNSEECVGKIPRVPVALMRLD